MRARIIAILTGLTLLVVSIWWFGFHGVHPAIILNPPPPTRTHHPQLDAIESIDVQNVTLQSILDELAAKYGFRYEIDNLGGKVAAAGISLRLDDVTLRALLNHLASEAHPEWLAIDAGDHIRITDRNTWFLSETNYETRFYPIAPDASLPVSNNFFKDVDEAMSAPSSMASLLEAVLPPQHQTFSLDPTTAVMDFPHGVLVTTTPDVHLLIADLITHLLENTENDASHRGTESILLASNVTSERESLLQKKLATKADFIFDNATWDEVQQWLAVEHDLPARLDVSSDAVDLRSGETKFSCELPQITLQNGLQMLLSKEELGLEIRKEVVWITDRLPRTLRVQHKLYPARDILMLADWQGDELVDLVTAMVAPSSWDIVGGKAVCRFAGNYLVVQQTSQVHDQLADFISQLRAELSPTWIHTQPATKPPSDNSLANKLQQPVTFDLENATLRDVLQNLRQEFGMRVWISARMQELNLADARFTLRAKVPSLWQALESLFQPYPDLCWKTVGETLVVTSLDDVEWNMPLRVYPLSPLASDAAKPAGASGARGIFYDELIEAIVNTFEPDSWEEVGGPGGVQIIGNCLVLRNSEGIQRRVQQCLAALAKARAADAPDVIPVTVDDKAYETLIKQLETPWSGELTATTRLEAVDAVRRHLQVPMLFTQQEDLVEAELTPLEEDELSLAELAAADVPLYTLLRGISPTSRYAFRDGILWIDALDDGDATEFCVYPLHDLAQATPQIVETLVLGIPQWIDESAWSEHGGYSSVTGVQDSLLVAATADNQRRIRGLLAALRDVAANPQKLEMRHVDLSVGQIDEKALELLRQPATSPAGVAVVERLLPASEAQSLTGLSLLVALQSQRPISRIAKAPSPPVVTTYGQNITLVPAAEQVTSLQSQLAVFPAQDLLARFEPAERVNTPDAPWYLPAVDLPIGGKGLATANSFYAPQESYLVDFIHHLFQYPWNVGDDFGVPELALVGTNLVVAADLASLWEIERIIQRLRDLLRPDAPLNWGESYQALQAVTSFQFKDAPLNEILGELERQTGFPIRRGKSAVLALDEKCQGEGNAENEPLGEAFSRLTFASADKQYSLMLKPTPEAVLVEIQRQPYQWLQVYDIRELDARYPSMHLIRLNQLIHEVGCDCFGPGVFGMVKPNVESIRGFVSVEAPPTVLADVRELIDILKTQHVLLSLLGDSPDAETATCIAWLEQALGQSEETMEQRLALWLIGELDDDVADQVVRLLEQDADLWKEPNSRELAISVMRRLGKRAAILVPRLLATAVPGSDSETGMGLVDIVVGCTNQPVEDLRGLLEVLANSLRTDRERTLVRAIQEVGKLGNEARPLVDDLVKLFTVAENLPRDRALRSALLRLESDRKVLQQAVKYWRSTHEVPPERAQDFNTERWLLNGRIQQVPSP